MRSAIAWGLAWSLGAGLAACEPAEGAGTIAVGVDFSGTGSIQGFAPSGTVVLRTARAERTFDLAEGLFEGGGLTVEMAGLGLDSGPRVVPHEWSRSGVKAGLPCHPDDGPVEVIVRFESATGQGYAQGVGGAWTWAPQQERRATVACRAGWEQGVSVGFESYAPQQVGRWRVRVVLEGAPAAAAGGLVVLGFPPDAGPFKQRVELVADGDALVGVWEGACVGVGTREVTVDVGALDVPGWSEAEVWAAWPPPARAVATLGCAVGEEREVEVVLRPRER